MKKKNQTQRETRATMSKIPITHFVYGNDSSTLGNRFKKWLGIFKNNMIANSISDTARMKASLLCLLDEESYDVYEAVKTSEDHTFEEVCTLLDGQFATESCAIAEKVVFRRAYRLEGEEVEGYALRLRKLSKNCGFTAPEDEILDQFVTGLGASMEEVQTKLIRSDVAKDLTLAKAIEIAKSFQNCRANLNALHKPFIASQSINFAGTQSNNKLDQKRSTKPTRPSECNSRSGQAHTNQSTSQMTCRNCGRPAHKERNHCPASGKQCDNCLKYNHFRSVCRSQPASRSHGQPNQAYSNRTKQGNGSSHWDSTNRHGIQNSSSGVQTNPGMSVNQINTGTEVNGRQVDEQDYAAYLKWKYESANDFYVMQDPKRRSQHPRVTILVNGQQQEHIVDSGAPINVLDSTAYYRLAPLPRLETCQTKYYAFNSQQPIPMKGQFEATIVHEGRQITANYVVTEGTSECLLSFETSVELGILQLSQAVSTQ